MVWRILGDGFGSGSAVACGVCVGGKTIKELNALFGKVRKITKDLKKELG